MPTTAIFQPDLFTFLRQLKRHNDREWFAKNKERYQQVVVEPAMAFISGFAPHLEKLSPHFVADAQTDAGFTVPHLPGHAILVGQNPLQDAYRDSLLARDRQGRPRASVLSASGTGRMLRGSRSVAPGQPSPHQNQNGDCRPARAVEEGDSQAGTRRREPDPTAQGILLGAPVD